MIEIRTFNVLIPDFERLMEIALYRIPLASNIQTMVR